MLIRIVRMTFIPEKTKDFLRLFQEHKEKIRQFDGCRHLSLLKDADEDNIYFTYSIWDDERDLNRYRSSGLFKNVWSATKACFIEKPVAYSLKKITEV